MSGIRFLSHTRTLSLSFFLSLSHALSFSLTHSHSRFLYLSLSHLFVHFFVCSVLCSVSTSLPLLLPLTHRFSLSHLQALIPRCAHSPPHSVTNTHSLTAALTDMFYRLLTPPHSLICSIVCLLLQHQRGCASLGRTHLV
jgi:hypothetical protein